MTAFVPMIWAAVNFAVGWFAAKRNPAMAWRVARWITILPGAVLAWLTIDGFTRANAGDIDTHRWLGHAMVIIVWICVPITVGVLLHERRSVYLRSLVAQLAILAILLAVVSLASMTGYLKATGVLEVAEETRNRFNVLHRFFLPSLLIILLIEWWWYFSPRKQFNNQSPPVTAIVKEDAS